MYCGDDVEAVVGDVGTSCSKFGLAGEDTPTLVVPTLVGKKPPVPVHPPSQFGGAAAPADAATSPYVLGDLYHARDVDVLHPIEACAVANWEALEQIWKYAFESLHVDPKQHPVITSAASCFANDALQNAANRDAEKYLEMMFEKFEVPAFYMAKDAVLDAFAFGRSCALIAEVGAGATRVVPVFDGYHLQRPAQYSSVGCNQLSAYLEYLVAKKNPTIEVRPRCCFTRKLNAHGKLETIALPTELITPPLMPGSYLKFMKSEIFRYMREATCTTSLAALTNDSTDDSSAMTAIQQRYELPDGKTVVLERECNEVAEFLLHPKNFADGGGAIVKTEQHAAAATKTLAKGLHKMLYDAVQLCDADLRRDMLSNIILCGGGSLTNGLTERLHAELTAMVPSTFKVRFTNVMKIERQFSVFIGGSILASLGSFQQLWVSKREYEEVGAHAICAQRFS
uniref:Actin n=1 Tax=Globisporangium ultimum (strain ATCC 200006 / CBS 805.95 / DAOM BR144) TaxID=431595 RepID=K3X8R4_GLOUD